MRLLQRRAGRDGHRRRDDRGIHLPVLHLSRGATANYFLEAAEGLE